MGWHRPIRKERGYVRSRQKMKIEGETNSVIPNFGQGIKYRFKSNWLRTQNLENSSLLRELTTTQKVSSQNSFRQHHVVRLIVNRIYASPHAAAVQKTSSRLLHTTKLAGKKVYASPSSAKIRVRYSKRMLVQDSIQNAISSSTSPPYCEPTTSDSTRW